MVAITLDTVLRRDEDVVYAALGDEGVMMNIDTGKYHGLNDVGARIWDLLDAPTTPAQLRDRLLDEFDVPAAACQAAVLAFAARLVDRGLAHVAR